MKKYDYYRPSASSLGKKRNLRKKRSALPFVKIILLLTALALIGLAVYLAVSKGYAAFSASKISRWQPSAVAVSGVEGALAKEVGELASLRLNKPFSVKDAAILREEFAKKYPQLRKVSVRRGLVSGKLSISMQRRTPLAKFIQADGQDRFIDSDATVYADPAPDALQNIPFVEVAGKVPEKLSEEFVELLQSTLSLGKDLNFSFLRFDLNHNTVKMFMPDGCVVDFGSAENLKKKAARAATIIIHSRERYKHPLTLDFSFFEEGKVFLTQTAD